MGFYRKINYFLVHTLMHTNRQARALLQAGAVEIDGMVVYDNCLLDENSQVKVSGIVVREARTLVYIRFYKPRGFESTLNAGVENNLASFFAAYNNLSIAGRLDKQSEGLLLLSNDGKWVEHICNPDAEKEKEYIVVLDKTPDTAFIKTFGAGVKIGSYITKPCTCQQLDETTLRIILREGKNRQIRRMCRRLGYEVLSLKRIRIDNHLLGDLRPGEWLRFRLS